MANELYTTGYEGFNITTFIEHLKNYEITCLLDVRENPVSRKPGFSKNRFAEYLRKANINYVHFGELGSPKSIREDLKREGDYSVFFNRYIEYLESKKDIIEKVYRYTQEMRVCLMCFEHLAATCHRKIVAQKIKERDGNGLKINHI
jgi:uncharacterized protein (DUF488 family)